MDDSYTPPANFRHAADELHDIVTRETGCDDFGPPDYLAGLTAMLRSMDFDPLFHERGRRLAWGQMVSVLRSRAQAVRSMKDNPGFDAAPILSPVVITGVPRTGTTALHRLMAVDPRFQGLQTWLIDSPMPRPPVESWGDYPQFRKTVAGLDAQYAAAPGHRAAHHRAAQEVHECCMVLWHSFCSNIWACGSWASPTYDSWWQAQDERAAYDYYYRCVQLIGSKEPEKRWLLKNPGHIENLDLLFAIFPGAKVIQTHRDPARAVPSLVSLLMGLHPLYEEDRADQRGENMLMREVARWSCALRKADAARKAHPGKVLDIVHADFHRDPMGVLEKIYGFIAMAIPDQTRAGFAARIAEKPELQHGIHRYAIADYGMTEDEARAPFGDYVQRFDLAAQGR
jgi:hypothetical protein